MAEFRKKFAALRNFLAKYAVSFIVGFAAAVLCYIVINDIVDRFSSPEYCGSCHATKLSYQSWKKSIHYKNDSGVMVDCIDCHLPPRKDFFRHLTAKAIHGTKDLYRHYMGIRTDPNELREYVTKTMPDARCTICHDGTLTTAGTRAAQIAHKAALEKGERCLDCHTPMHNWEAVENTANSNNL